MNRIADRRTLLAGPVLALVFAGLTVGCTHEYQITPTFQRSLAQLPSRPVCPQSESIEVTVVNQSANPLDAGQVTAGVHTFNHHFAQDPAVALQAGLTSALREGKCAFSSPATADLKVEIVNMEAHGEVCGFTSCEGTAQAKVSVSLVDASGKVLSREVVSAAANDDCGMTFCNEEESSKLATRALSEAVGKTVAAITVELAKREVPLPVAAAAATHPGS